jgi:hypothetical protein
MTRWGYSPIENIAFALQNIAKILERIENKMPVPGGEITTSEILVPKEPVDAFAEINNAELAAYDAAMADALEKAEDDLPELS